jgi:hypothetical protein
MEAPMKVTRAIGLLVAALLTTTAVAATAIPASATPPPKPLSYQGLVAGVVSMEGDGCMTGTFSGTWAADVPDRKGDTIWVTFSLLLDGQPHADWMFPFDRTGPATPGQFSGQLLVPDFGDVLTVTMKHSRFEFRLYSPMLECDVTFYGPRVS